MVTSFLPSRASAGSFDLVVVLADLDAAGLTAGAGVDLGLDDPTRAADLAGAIDGLLGAIGQTTARDRHVELREKLLGLVLVNVHGVDLLGNGCFHRFLLFGACGFGGLDRRGGGDQVLRHLLGSRVDHLAVEGGSALALGFRFLRALRGCARRDRLRSRVGEKTSLASSICEGWIAHLPSHAERARRGGQRPCSLPDRRSRRTGRRSRAGRRRGRQRSCATAEVPLVARVVGVRGRR